MPHKQNKAELRWPGTIAEAREMQVSLASKVKVVPLKKMPAYVAGVDAAFSEEEIIAVASLYSFPEMRPVEDSVFRGKVRFPYVPGYLSFREGPAVIRAVEKLSRRPDLLVVDGQGIAHPRRIGIASHVGVVLNMTTIGCAKSRLTGRFGEPGPGKGDWTYLYPEDGGLLPLGGVVRTRVNVRPVFVSPGHLIDIESSIEVVLRCTTLYRIPEPVRRADMLSRRLKYATAI